MLDDQLKIKKLPLAIIREALTSLWFLWALLGSLCLVAVAQMAGRYRSAILFFFVLAILFLPAVSHLYLFEYTFPFFIGGFLVAHVGDRIVAMPPKLLIGIVLALLTSGCYVLWEDNTYIYVTKMTLSIDNLPNILFRWVAGAIVSVFILLLLFQAYRAASARIRGVFISLGQDSIFIYILQGYAFQILTKVFIYQSISFSTLIVGDIFAVILGVLVTWCCWFLGQSLARNQAVARVLFGRMRKIQIESKMM